MSETCENCKFWKSVGKRTICKKMPPQVTFELTGRWENEWQRYTVWPEINRHNWCGCWEESLTTTDKATIKTLLMALPNKNRLEIWEMVKQAEAEVCAYNDDDLVENTYNAIFKEIDLHIEV